MHREGMLPRIDSSLSLLMLHIILSTQSGHPLQPLMLSKNLHLVAVCVSACTCNAEVMTLFSGVETAPVYSMEAFRLVGCQGPHAC